ncbi:small GTP-binding protein, putative [Trichomonas vaginalis G3]|uniref:Small GTP-binding protein, putative n=1 Tax=Trichomonas vaginalis (strain ATCC PRA-98 / G3) TaxID=412133 RepID=A2FR38_TRIV3|nr:P-loop containing nucleoside triphosphate hydrolases family [Trichomonas vaginalis G3]EAX92627.1 small GTP-binding protein, putative [Trichomonas vaginalis G3]KAI5540097.1 P-loop containing nucleoside triphosphate hydrolases family [Trichomonas vaginalis G3]|eukprot:XP_001305557.1 small GTP-binding protein [Trichomonas vaginalis G3]
MEEKKFTVVVIGERYSGKSTFIYRVIQKVFDAERQESIATSVINYERLYHDVNYKIQFWDTPGTMNSLNYTKSTFKSAFIVLVFFDPSPLEEHSAPTIEHLPDWVKLAKESVDNIYIVASFSDLWEKDNPPYDKRSYEKKYKGIPMFEISSKTGDGIELLLDSICYLYEQKGQNADRGVKLTEKKKDGSCCK